MNEKQKNNFFLYIIKKYKLKKKSGKKYTKEEAFLNLMIDFYEQNKISSNYYATLWGWSRDKVKKFIFDIGLKIKYSEDTKCKQNQKGNLLPKEVTYYYENIEYEYPWKQYDPNTYSQKYIKLFPKNLST